MYIMFIYIMKYDVYNMYTSVGTTFRSTTKKYVKSGGFNMAIINNRHKFQYNTSFH